jgi:thiol-disulfide isomerase/thioredoxin
MKRAVLLLICALWCAAWIASCGANSSSSPAPHSSSNFAVTLEKGSGTFTPQVNVSSDSTHAVVTISTSDASDLAAAYMHLSYDASKYTPASVEFGTMLGTDGNVLNLALTDIAADVPIGICQVATSGIIPVSGSGTLATVHFTATPFQGKSVSATKPPTPVINRVSDLAIIGQDTQSVTLHWTEHHPGDTDNNGEVNLSDLTNVGKYLNMVVQDQADPLAVGMADCDGNGTVTINELTTIGQNFNTVLDGYVLFTDASATETYGNPIKRSDVVSDDPKQAVHPYQYTTTVQLSGLADPSFSVAPIAPADTTHVGPQSNVAQSIVVDGAPDAPTALQANGSQAIGNGKVKLNWTPSAAADVVGYEVERQVTNPAGPFEHLATVPGTGTSYVDSDAALTDQEYGYQIRAVDVTGLFSDYTAVATATPYFIPAPSAPTGFTAVTSVDFGAAVDLAWTAPADNSAAKFRVYRQGPGESSFTKIYQSGNALVHDLHDQNLTPETDYQYYVVSVNTANIESPATPTLTAKSSEQAAIVVTGFTTNKTTHCNSLAEPASQLTVTTDIPADSLSFTGPGVFTTTAGGGTWKPNGSTPLGASTLTVTAHKGSKTSSKTLEVYVTQQSILTQYGQNGGHFIDFNDGGHSGAAEWNTVPSVRHKNAPYYPFSGYADGKHVVDFNLWGTWCGPCVAEMPTLHDWATHYAGKFYYVGMNEFNGDTVAAAENFFNSRGYDNMDSYHPWIADLWAAYGESGFVPVSILFDMDGYARLWITGGISGADETKWNTTISECTGMPPAS